jgi:ornithine cyclodeaminase/alanine dehydrogenase-like protein (mu-crystallin family)
MIVIDSDRIDAVLTPGALVESLRTAFAQPIEIPVRHHHAMARRGEPDATLLLMPAWHGAEFGPEGRIGVKVVSVVPGNAARGRATVVGSYLLFSGETGEPLAVLDGRALTMWRTAAASALAASYLARTDARSMVMVGAGALAPFLIAAHATVRPIETVAIWNRNPAKAADLAMRLDGAMFGGRRLSVRPTDDLSEALGEADLVSAATLSDSPIVRGVDLPPGIHVDLVGGFTPAMREADDAAIARAEVHVDTYAGACAEAGDIVQPIASGILRRAGIRSELAELCRGEKPGRTDPRAVTLFKSVGTALEDLAAASLVYQQVAGR